MAGKVFINYRRDDSSGTAGRLYDRLANAFGRNNVFMDVDHIPAGVDFVQHLDTQVAASDVFLVILGPHWLDAKDEAGERRLDNPEDFVAIEIAAALTRDIRVIPVLVDGARMPKSDKLPDALKPLVRRNAVEVRNSQFGRDADALTAKVREALHVPRKGLGLRAGLAALAAAVLVIVVGAALYLGPGIWRSQPASPPAQTAQTPPPQSAPPPPSIAGAPIDREKNRQIRTFPGNKNGVTWAAYAPGGTAIVTNASYGEPGAVFKVMDIKSGQILKGYGGTKGIRGAPFAPDGKSLVSYGRTPELRWWDAAEPLRQWVHTVQGAPEWVNALTFAPDGQTYVLAPSDGIMRVHETQSGRELFRVTGHQGWLWNAIFSPDGRFVLYGGMDGIARLWDAQARKPHRELPGASGRVVALAFSPDSRTAYSGSADGAIRVWDVASGRLLRAFTAHAGETITMAMSSGGRFLASGGTDHLVKIWDLTAETEALTLAGHTGNVWMVSIAPDGRSVVSGGIDEFVRLWDISDLTAKDAAAPR
jgi:WD40 repeat protein